MTMSKVSVKILLPVTCNIHVFHVRERCFHCPAVTVKCFLATYMMLAGTHASRMDEYTCAPCSTHTAISTQDALRTTQGR